MKLSGPWSPVDRSGKVKYYATRRPQTCGVPVAGPKHAANVVEHVAVASRLGSSAEHRAPPRFGPPVSFPALVRRGFELKAMEADCNTKLAEAR